MKRNLSLILVLVLALLVGTLPAAAQDGPNGGPLINVNDQELFLSGMNLAWINFGRDLQDFNEREFVAFLDDIQWAKGNTIRWWLHNEGSTSPVYDEDGYVSGLGENDLRSMRRALDLAYERGIMIMMTLWSHDMMRTDAQGIPTEYNKLLIEDPEYTQAYIDNALIPMVTELAGHPGIVAWEIFNEPEGVTEEFGWTDERTTMAHIQQFVNLVAGAIHRADPDVLVTNGSWNMQVLTDIDPFFNYYTDERLIEAGGDPDGTLDFYQTHYYPEHFDEATSPFHNPYSHWELDKPLVVGEFPAAGLFDMGNGYKPRRVLPTSVHTFRYLFENGYAGGLSWDYQSDDFGTWLEAAPGMLYLGNTLAPEYVTLNVGEIDRIPTVEEGIDNMVVPNDTPSVTVDLAPVFEDAEDGDNLSYGITKSTNPELVNPVLDEGALTLEITTGEIGSTIIEVTAFDSTGKSTFFEFVVQVVDPNLGNVALGKPTTASSVESNLLLPEYATDGVDNTRWSTEYADEQWLMVDLQGVFDISQIVLEWEVAYGKHYEIQFWDGEAWQTVFTEENSDGGVDDVLFDEPLRTRYVLMHGIERGTQWGFSLWEFEINGVRAEGDFPALETEPTIDIAAPEEPETAVTASELLYSFEDGVGDWVLADFWAAVSSVEQTTEMAAEGDAALMLTGSYSGTEWQEGGVFVDTPDGVDYSAYTHLTVDVYAPEGAEGFIAQIFMKTGEEWTWMNTADTSLNPGEWNTLSAELANMGDPTDVREIGVKIGTSVTAFEGTFFVDNVTLMTVEVAEEPAMTFEYEGLYSFEEDDAGWVLADFWAAMSGMERSDEMASDGDYSLKLTGSFNGTEWQEGGVFVDTPDGVDLSTYYGVSVDVYVPEGAEGFIAQIFMKTGEEWTWVNTADFQLAAGEWNTLTAELANMGDAADVREIGVKIGTSATAFEGDFFVDNVALVIASEAPADAEMVFESEGLYSFEEGVGDWVIADFWTAVSNMEVSDEMASDGDYSLKLTGSFNGTEWQEGGVFVDTPDGVDLSAYHAVAVDVYVPEGAEGFIAQIFVKTGEDWAWANTADFQLTAGEWNTLTAELANLGDAADVREIGVKIGTSMTAFEGDFFVDNVALISAMPASEAAMVAESLYSFEDDEAGWVLADYWAAMSGFERSDEMATDGEYSLKLSGTFSGTAWEEGGVFVDTPDGVDLSAYHAVAVDVYVPEGAEGFLAQIFMKTGEDWAWVNTPDITLVPGEWNTLTAELANMGDASDVREIGVKIGTSVGTFEGDFFIDNVTLIGAEQMVAPGVEPVVREIAAIYPFELTVGLYEKFEIDVELDADFNNPYDPTDIRLDARFTSPSGRSVTVPGFYQRDYTLEIVEGREQIAATGESSWRIRFTPDEVGEWHYRVMGTTAAGTVRSRQQSFTVTESDEPGFVRVDPRNPRYLAFDDGTPYFPIGENMAWYGNGRMADYVMWLDALSANGGNFIRVWMPAWALGIEWNDTGLGNYDARQDEAARLDMLLEMADQRDVYIMLTLINHGQYSVTTNAEWDANPYNAANGGPLESPIAFGTHPEARRLWHQRLRYIAARWGYSTNIMAWEWWNEVNWTPLVNPEVLAPWAERSANFLSTLDPYDHLITHSGSPLQDEVVWNQMDITQHHMYNMRSVQTEFSRTIPDWLERYPDRPFLMGEFGSPSEYDLDGVLFHLGLWSAPMNGAAGTGMMWWWDTYVHPNDQYYHFAAISAYFADEDLAAHDYQPHQATLEGDARVYGLQDETSALLWVVSKQYTESYFIRLYERNLIEGVDNPTNVEFPEERDATLTLNGLADGNYAVEWWNTMTSEIASTVEVQVTNRTATVDVPTFNTDWAMKVKPTS